MSDDHPHPMLPPLRPEGEPSDLALDRYAAGELEGEARAAVEAALARSPATLARYRERETAFTADPTRPERLWSAIERGLDAADEAAPAASQRAPGGARRWLRAWLEGAWPLRLAALGVVGVVAAAVATRVEAPAPVDRGLDEGVRVKGSVGLAVHRKVDGGSEPLLSGATVAPGEALRFTVDAPEAGDLMVLAVDPRGAVSPVYPPGAASSTSLPAGRDQLLPVAVTVDDTPGDLWLHAVLCPRRFGPTDLRVGAGAGELVLPAGCASAPFLLRTAAP
ncbi:MAG: hypothetical protein KC635_20875 [Myxococcales bacterium]|nr:hypothetical protein [Myxococcales bacterium]